MVFKGAKVSAISGVQREEAMQRGQSCTQEFPGTTCNKSRNAEALRELPPEDREVVWHQ